MTKQHRSEQTDDPSIESKRFKWPPNLARGHLEICVKEKRKGDLINEKPEAKTLRNYPIRDIPLIEQLFFVRSQFQ
ncbi:hypothetical protein CARUB_v10025715mg [Capsella rubella]|uniref:Uncharacterized protein n=1 Tax=Capsella rubella TaxID=81985 RepID=R0HI95_9BRAS|nr:hypothetical protein CARUB_v10025715mg [Capsella rubella]